MNIQFLWRDEYAVNHPLVDQQHQRLFDIVNTLPDNLDVPRIRQIIGFLFQHARDHFQVEEGVMAQHGYPGLADHRKLHEDLVTQLTRISETATRDEEAYLAFKKFLTDWIIDHILTQDKDFFRFVHDHQA